MYGRETEQRSVVDSITHGECFENELTVLPIVGPGGIGKATFTQHVYQEVKSHFQVTIWICVSLNFNANRLAQEAVIKMPEVLHSSATGNLSPAGSRVLHGCATALSALPFTGMLVRPSGYARVSLG